MVYDEETGGWVPKWGYKGKGGGVGEEWIVEVDERKEREKGGDGGKEGKGQGGQREGGAFGGDRRERKEKARRNERKMRANERKDRRASGGV